MIEFKVEFIEGNGAEGAAAQTEKIMAMAKDGWEWHGFASTSRATLIDTEPSENGIVLQRAATETAGVFLYFRRMPKVDLESPPLDIPGVGNRATRRRIARLA